MTPKINVILLGNGGHASVLREILSFSNVPVLGHVGPKSPNREGDDSGWLGEDDAVRKWAPEDVQLVNGVGSSDVPELRSHLFETFCALGYRFRSLQHPSAIVSPSAALHHGCQIMAGAVVQSGCRISENVLINTGAVIDHDVEIGRHSHVASGAVVAGGVTIGERCHIGAGATVIQGLSIAEGAVVGAGAVVLSSVPPGTTVAGVPASPIRTGR